VIIEGYSQPGAVENNQTSTSNASLKIELAGTNLGNFSVGLRVSAGGSTIRGLAINRFPQRGIDLSTNGNNFIVGNYIGTNVEGTAALPNGASLSGQEQGGVRIFSTSSSNTIGGTAPGDRNLISGNKNYGIRIDSGSNRVWGNLLGPDNNGETSLTTDYTRGVLIQNAASNTIGGITGVTPEGDCRGACNVISGNGGGGIEINGSSSTGNLVQGNRIGTNAAGTAALGNPGAGVSVRDNASNNTIGGNTVLARNVISGNSNGVSVQSSNDNEILGNYIGTDVTGVTDLGNSSSGVTVSSSSDIIIGGNTSTAGTPPGNVISGSTHIGISVGGAPDGSSTSGIQVKGNLIGTDASGSFAIGNRVGVEISRASGITVGGDMSGDRNIIAGNSEIGVFMRGQPDFNCSDSADNDSDGRVNDGCLQVGLTAESGAQCENAINDDTADDSLVNDGCPVLGAAAGNTLSHNYVGTNASGSAAVENYHGVTVQYGASNTISNNVVSGSRSHGIEIDALSVLNSVVGNYVGTDAAGSADLGNGWHGVYIRLSNDNSVSGNLVSGNTVDGIVIDDSTGTLVTDNSIGTDASGTTAIGNSENGVFVYDRENSIGGTGPGEPNIIAFNGQNGIRIRGAAATGNAVRQNSIHSNTLQGINNDTGGNTELPPPVVTGTNPATGTACANCEVDVFSDNADEGRTYHGSTTADGAGAWTLAGVVTGPNVTATATNAAGNTSEFSLPACLDYDSDDLCDTTDADDDGEGLTDVVEANCGSDSLNALSRPERIDGAFAGVSDDSDASVDEALPASAANFDCDGDGYTGSVEAGTPLCSGGANDDGTGPLADDTVANDGCPGGPPQEGTFSEAQFHIATNDQDPCGIPGWPSDFVSGGIPNSTNRITLTDLTSFTSVPRKFGTSPVDANYNQRWDLLPGRGLLGQWINLNDLTALTLGATGTPPMFSGNRAFNGPTCPWP
jgi:titin